MVKFLIFGTLLYLAPLPNPSEQVPSELFGVELGSVHKLSSSSMESISTLPIKKFTGIQKFLGSGIHYYFKPLSHYSAFPYHELKKTPDDEYFPTTFRLYMLPLIPKEISSREELEQTSMTWKVMLIEWSLNDSASEQNEDAEEIDFAKNLMLGTDQRSKNYRWSAQLCKTFEADLEIEPQIEDQYDLRIYECRFSTEGRVLEISSYPFKSVQLRFRDDVFNREEKAVETRLLQIKAEEIRPY